MCGIAGAVAWKPGTNSTASRMADALVHRGPDAGAEWRSTDLQVAFGHRRLAIIDLSPAGAQPMHSASGRWTLVYNGELYNTDTLRAAVGRPTGDYRGHSDTEVLLAAIERFGVHDTVRKLNGMFAFAAWDAHERRLWLARDRFGEKPLYYGWHHGTLLFASELKALRSVEGFRPGVSRPALAQLLRYGFVPGEHTVFERVYTLLPGHVASVDATTHEGRLETSCFWDPVTEALSVPPSPAPRSQSAVDELEDLLSAVVSSRMVSDVPLGAFLSGGIDSSTVVALMQRTSTRPVRTFTIGFSEAGYDESGFARDVARHLGTDHTELILSPADAMAIIPRLAHTYCEPFADSSQIPTYLVSQLARQHVTVALSGDGGDELFGGYDRYRVYQRLLAARGRVPARLGHLAGRALTALPGHRLDALAGSRLGRVLPRGARNRTGERVHKLGRLLAGDGTAIYRDLMSGNATAEALVVGLDDNSGAHGPYLVDQRLAGRSPLDQAMLLDTLTYLPDDLLVKVDRASMAHSLEVRVPLLDPDVFRFAWGLHPDDKVRDGQGKWVLREVLKRHVPAELVDRPKMGFGVPIGAWLRGPLSAWVGDLLDPGLMREQGYLHAEPVQALWRSHQDRKGDHTYELWPVLMFQAWLKEWL